MRKSVLHEAKVNYYSNWYHGCIDVLQWFSFIWIWCNRLGENGSSTTTYTDLKEVLALSMLITCDDMSVCLLAEVAVLLFVVQLSWLLTLHHILSEKYAMTRSHIGQSCQCVSVNANLGKMILQFLVLQKSLERSIWRNASSSNARATLSQSQHHTTTTHRLRAEAWRMHPL